LRIRTDSSEAVISSNVGKGFERIDGIVAMIIALERATTGSVVTRPLFVWDSRDGVTL
jgi:hypothetical protein